MSKLLSTIFFSFFLFSQTISFAEEGDVEQLVVPEAHEESTTLSETDPTEVEESTQDEEPQVIDEPTNVDQVPQQEETQDERTDTTTTENPTENVDKEQSEEVSTEVEAPSEDQQEATQAEEAELREVGAGEEPIIE